MSSYLDISSLNKIIIKTVGYENLNVLRVTANFNTFTQFLGIFPYVLKNYQD